MKRPLAGTTYNEHLLIINSITKEDLWRWVDLHYGLFSSRIFHLKVLNAAHSIPS